jgi:hypothetical protein
MFTLTYYEAFMKKQIFIFSSLLFISSQLYALPRFALLKGDANCLGCHVNPTGGQLRGPGGVSYAINDLPMWKRGDSIKYTGEISPGIRLGGDFRSQVLYFSQKGPLGVTGNDTTYLLSTFHAMSLAFELDIKATNTLHGFFRYDPLGITPTEGWALLHFVHSSGEIFQSTEAVTNAYVKVGSFLPAFGIRYDDHTVYVKGGTANVSGFNRQGFFWSPGYRDVGAEMGALFFDHLGIVAGVFNGSEQNPTLNFSMDPSNSRAFCVRANLSGEIVEDLLSGEIGFSRYIHNQFTGNMNLNAAHFALRIGPVTILNEYDFGNNIVTSDIQTIAAKANAFCSEAAINLTKGFDAILRFETFKDQDSTGATITQVKNRIMIGAQWFPLRFLEIRPEYRLASTTQRTIISPNTQQSIKENTILIQTHVFF